MWVENLGEVKTTIIHSAAYLRFLMSKLGVMQGGSGCDGDDVSEVVVEVMVEG